MTLQSSETVDLEMIVPVANRLLDNLRIQIVDMPTTKDTIDKADRSQLAESIKNYTWRRNKGKDRGVV